MAVTIKDVAALAGVSPSTVSRTCKDHPSISDETKEKVRRAIAQLGYEPNFQASNLATQTSRMIGVILPPSKKDAFENTFYLEVLRGISQFCNKHQYINTIITGANEEEILQVIRTMVRCGQVDGFILLFSKQQDQIVDYLYENGLLYVLIGKAIHYANQTIYIDNDNLLAAQEATDYLFNLGHRKIAFLGGDGNMVVHAQRKAGYISSLVSHSLSVQPSDCVEIPQLTPENDERIRAMLKHPDPPTAILVSDDILAVSLERVCMEMNLKIPDDLSIFSFNNSLFARITASQLTSMDINALQLGVEAASQMINHIENPNLMATKIIVPHHMVVRSSCKKIGDSLSPL